PAGCRGALGARAAGGASGGHRRARGACDRGGSAKMPFILPIRTIWACDLQFHASPFQDITPSCVAWVLALIKHYSLRSPAHHRPDVSLSWALPQAFASSGILLPSGIRLAPPL